VFEGTRRNTGILGDVRAVIVGLGGQAGSRTRRRAGGGSKG
jgi:hypothetical protein